MQHVILIPDSFKGTLSSAEICSVLREEVLRRFPGCTVSCVPVADGGEGSVDCFLTALGGRRIPVSVCGPFGEPTEAFFGMLPDGKTAVVEMAACAGLPLAEGRLDPLRATTFGVGELFLAAAEHGASQIIVGLGGSATNDGGCGAAAACGVRFLNRDGMPFVPAGGTLAQIAHIDASGFSPVLRGVEFTAMCDIDNPLFGPNGAAAIFAPQKGASAAQVMLLDDGLRSLAEVISRELSCEVGALPGGGAAGGMGAGMSAFFGASLRSGIETVLDTVRFDRMLQTADWVITGEGRLDSQSLRGKVVIGVAQRAKAAGVPVIAVVGDAEDGLDGAYEAGVTAVFPINRRARDFHEIRHLSRSFLAQTAADILRLIAQAEQRRPESPEA
ncbi:MAG: glycerate kinase [Firmicutes bacterium]|nr:glycerate kinase [Bacillota bacterium]